MSKAVARKGGGSDLGVIVGVVVAIVALIYFFGGGDRTSRLDRAATGFAGMVEWLRAGEVETLVFRGEGSLSQDRVGLRVLPVYDVDLQNDRVAPTNNLEIINQFSESDLALDVFDDKVALLPTLVILPKWRTGVRALGFAHQGLLIPPPELDRLLGQIGERDARMLREQSGLTTLTYELDGSEMEVTLFHAQTVSLSTCVPILGSRRAMLFGRCQSPSGADYHLLADPDVMSNHGLRLGGNADLAFSIIERMAGERQVVFDLTNRVHTYERRPTREIRERSPDELARMFRYPFSVLWFGFALVSLLVLWRAIVRYGPLARIYDDEPRASKEVSIAAKARLLRLSNHDAPLLNSHITQRIQALASDLIGPHRPPGVDGLTLVTRLVGRKSPVLADELREASIRAADDTTPHELVRQLDRFESVFDRIEHEFGRTSGAR